MRNRFFIIVFSSLIFVAACTNNKAKNCCKAHDKTHPTYYQELAVLYQQQSAEMRALCYQAFAMGKLAVEKAIREHKGSKQMAVVVDIDDTMLDNSPYQAQAILENFQYPTKWDEWCMQANAKPMPGAVEFMQYVQSKNIDIFYVSNRKAKLNEATAKNLANLGFPQVEDKHLMLQTAELCKENRRKKIQETHDIILLVGDNVNDFFNFTENKGVEERIRIIDSLQNDFGFKYIMLPNTTYGDWEGAIYNYDYAQAESKKDSIRKSKLQGF